MKLRDIIQSYSPDQPRTSDGRFGSGDANHSTAQYSHEVLKAAPSTKVEGEWRKTYPSDGEAYHPFSESDSDQFHVIRDRSGKLVAAASVMLNHGDDVPGITGAFVNIIRSHAPGAGAALIRELQKKYKIVEMETETADSTKMAQKLGFIEHHEGGAGPVHVWFSPTLSQAKREQYDEATL